MKTEVTKNGKPEIPTLRQLREMLPSTAGLQAPSLQWFKTNPKRKLLSFEISDVRIDVYDNGFFTYTETGYVSILRADGFNKLIYDSASSENGYETVSEECYIDQPWYIAFLSYGETISTNNHNRREYYLHEFSIITSEDDSRLFPYNTPSAEVEMVDAIDKRSIKEMISKSISCLTQKQQQVIKMYFVCNMQQSEIAANLGIKQQAVSRIMLRAISQMKKDFQAFLSEGGCLPL